MTITITIIIIIIMIMIIIIMSRRTPCIYIMILKLIYYSMKKTGEYFFT